MLSQLGLLEVIFSQQIKRESYFVKFICPMKHAYTTNETEMKT
jgi:hypothetical protein